MSVNFKQFKLSNGDEVVADVVDSEEDVLIIRAPMRIVELENVDEGFSYFSLRPFVAFQDTIDTLQLLNTSQIILETSPSDSIMKHYANAIHKMSFMLKGGKCLEDLESMTDEEIRSHMDNILEEAEDIAIKKDLAKLEEDEKLPENVVKLKPKGTFH